eukprot:scaffold4012_cov63-Phaeocystis_antarctica.AAC.4
MARLFPDSRFAAYPMPFHRAAAVKSLVNGQLDSLRALLFKPEIYTWWERLLVGTGLSTNVRRLSAAPPPPPAPHHHLGTTTTTTLPRYTAHHATPPYQVLFPTLVAALLIASLGGGVEVGTALAAKARGEERRVGFHGARRRRIWAAARASPAAAGTGQPLHHPLVRSRLRARADATTVRTSPSHAYRGGAPSCLGAVDRLLRPWV